MKLVNIIVHFRGSEMNTKYTSFTHRLYDWYDFADWLKQREVRGYETTVIKWEYDVRHI